MTIGNRIFLAALLAGGLLGIRSAGAQSYIYTPTYAAPPVPTPYAAPAPVQLSDQQLDQLLGPVALYPDPLLSEVLAAATYPQDVLAAQQWLQYFPTPTETDINNQPWDASVKALVHYPSVLQMLASQPDWMESLGAAFASQQQDVSNSIQRLRAEAQAANTLTSSQQQQVVADNGVIEILPAQPNVIYVPSYDPDVVYVQHPGIVQPWITFGGGFAAGAWLDLGWDWHDHRIDRGYRWDHDWRHPVITHGQPWRHDPGRPLPRPRFVAPPRGGFQPGRGWNDDHHDHHRNPPASDNRFQPGRGWNDDHHDDHRNPPAFDNHLPPHDDGHRGNERPVQGLPPRPAEPPHRAEPPRRVETPHPQPERHVEAPHPQPSHVEAPRPQPQRPAEVHPQQAPHPAERPVQGLPTRPNIARPGLVGHTASPPQNRSAPSAPAFHGGDAGPSSARGHSSMHR